MNNIVKSLLATALCFYAYSASAATTTENSDDASALGTSDTPQIQQQNKTTDTPRPMRNNMKKSRMHKSNAEIKMMDTNSDGMISKDEYMTYNEGRYGRMKQTDGMVNAKDMEAEMYKGTTRGNKLQPSDTKNTAPESKNY